MIDLSALEPVMTSYEVTASIETALCIGAGGSSGSLADKSIVRTATGHLLIPASQLKGRLRHECEKLARGLGWPVCNAPKADRMCPQRSESNSSLFERDDYRLQDGRYHCLICQIFGNPSLPSRLEVDDLICTTPPEYLAEVIRPGVTINRRRRTAEDQKLYFLETSPPALDLEFQGSLHLSTHAPPQAKALLLAACKHIHALGGSKSAGLGWLSLEIQGMDCEPTDIQALLPEGQK